MQGLLGVLTTAVSHPDKDRILHQLKGQLAAMNVDAVRKLQFGGSAPTPAPTPAPAPAPVKDSPVEETEPTPVPASRAPVDNRADEDGLGSELEKQLARVASLAGRLSEQKPLLLGSERQIIKSKLPTQLELDSENVAQVFPVPVREDIFVVMPEVTTTTSITPSQEEEEEEEEEIAATTLRNLFKTERVQKIKMTATTPGSVREELQYENVLDGVPSGEPGLTKNFFERVPFLPQSIR